MERRLLWTAAAGALTILGAILAALGTTSQNSAPASTNDLLTQHWGVAAFAAIAGLMIVALGIGCVSVPAKTPADPWINIAILMAGFIAGAVLGTLLSPITEKETTVFQSYTAAALSAGISGYVVARLEKWMPKLYAPGVVTEQTIFRTVCTVAAVLIGFSLFWVARTYAH